MAIKKSELYSSLWRSCDELRGGMDASQYSIGAAAAGADGDRQDRQQIMRFRALQSGIPQVGTMGRAADTGLGPDKWMQTHSRTANGV